MSIHDRIEEARVHIENGAAFPYDAGELWWESDDGDTPPPATDWAHAAARGVLHDLCDRKGIKWELEQVDHEIRAEITQAIAEIIRQAHKMEGDK